MTLFAAWLGKRSRLYSGRNDSLPRIGCDESSEPAVLAFRIFDGFEHRQTEY